MSHDARVPSRESCVLRYLVDAHAEQRPKQVFAVFTDGSSWTYDELRHEVLTTAAGLQSAGVRQGDRVVCWLPNGPDAVRFWFAINYVGAVYVPMNTAYRGSVLTHVLTNADADLLIADGGLIDRLKPGSCGRISQIACVGASNVTIDGLHIYSADELRGTACEPLERPIEPWDTQAILYTSGTTGPSKGVLSSYMQSYAMFGPVTMPFITADDRYMINMPLFHVGGTGLLYSMLMRGGSVAVIESFSVSRFWDQIRETQATVVFLLGVMASFIDRTPRTARDRDHPLKTVIMVPLVDDVAGFVERFGVDVYSIYNMTELSAPLITERNPTIPGTCGRVRPGVEVRLVDENDCEVPVGAIGEFVVRTDAPWALNHGYFAMPEATAKAWRNGWFHTGDLGRRDADGNYFFVDRLKDSIRRRGENISSMELEAEIYANPKIREVAVIAVPSEFAEDEVMAVVSLVPGEVLEPEELIDFLRSRVAYFTIPRYIRFVDEIPKTASSKIHKVPLRQAGITPDTWDRERHGVRVTR
ncbi:MAG TPA: AMP-binding protein [Jatrophihabitans sp.]|nr:AMP-binding protein [Jatrophihabitans sp.]